MKKFLVTVFHDSADGNAEILSTLKHFGYEKSFIKDGKSVDLPENMFIRVVEGEDSIGIKDKELLQIKEILEENKVEHEQIGVFVGDDWRNIVNIID